MPPSLLPSSSTHIRVSSHPVEVEVNHPDEIRSIFDAISYAKGSAVIRVALDYVGDAAFQQGIHEYLENLSYKNAKTDQLWTSLAKASNKPVGRVMENWIKKTGYPVVMTTQQPSAKPGVVTFRLSQRRFLQNSKNIEEEVRFYAF